MKTFFIILLVVVSTQAFSLSLCTGGCVGENYIVNASLSGAYVYIAGGGEDGFYNNAIIFAARDQIVATMSSFGVSLATGKVLSADSVATNYLYSFTGTINVGTGMDFDWNWLYRAAIKYDSYFFNDQLYPSSLGSVQILPGPFHAATVNFTNTEEHTYIVPEITHAEDTFVFVNEPQILTQKSIQFTNGNTVLDWVEEGTFTPQLKIGGTNATMSFTIALGKFQRMISMVTFSIAIKIDNPGNGTGEVRIDGLPYPIGELESRYQLNFNNVGFLPVADAIHYHNVPYSLFLGWNDNNNIDAQYTQGSDLFLVHDSEIYIQGHYFM